MATGKNYFDQTISLKNYTTTSLVSTKSRGPDQLWPQPRYNHNEDSVGWYLSPDGKTFRMIVADGAGGHGGGQTASGLTVSTMLKLSEQGVAVPLMISKVQDRMEFAYNNATPDQQQKIKNMTTTLAVVEISEGYFQSWHLGDSRVMIHRGDGVLFETQDQFLKKLDPVTGVPRKYITGAISLKDGKAMPTPSSLEQSERIKLQRGDIIIVASDGVWDVLDASDVDQIIKKTHFKDPEKIRNEIMKRVTRRRSTDNITLVVTRYDGN